MAISQHLLQILDRLADGRFHSGTELAESAAISRSAVCKQLQNLDKLDLGYSAISGKGYKLNQPLQLLDENTIRQALNENTRALLQRLEIHPCLASTNTYLQHAGSAHATACFAEYQTAGRGRRGRQWVSPFGRNIYLSLRYHYQSGPAVIAGLSLAVGVAVIRALNSLNISDAGLKWPNDIYWQHKKLGGILIEVGGEAEGPCHAVVGLGLNGFLPQHLSQTIDQPCTDLYSIVGDKAFTLRNRLAAALLNQLTPVLHDFDATALSSFIEEWRQYDCLYGKTVTLYQGKQQHQGILDGIDEHGQLLLCTAYGNRQTFASGEISFRPGHEDSA